MIAGYFWLAAGGLLWILFAQFFSTGPYYDAMLHAIFLGFVFSMIFADAPIILPTITGVALSFGNVFELHAGLLHVSLFLRVAGDFRGWLSLHQWGGMLNDLGSPAISDKQCARGEDRESDVDKSGLSLQGLIPY